MRSLIDHVSLFIGVLAILSSIGNVTAQANLDVERIERATVFVIQAQAQGDDLFITCVGSGTLVSRDGLILTNANHSAVSETCPGNTLIIALNVNAGEPPIPRYQAEIVQVDIGLDLALLRIARQSDGRLIDSTTLALPFVELAPVDALSLDDTLIVAGFPGFGDDEVMIERGTVVGFTAEPAGGDQSWVKTSAILRGTMAGGGAYNEDGQLVGIPTGAPLNAQAPDATCLSVQDTDGDGLISGADICIPVGGAINSLRPASFARPLLRAASLGLAVSVPESFTLPPTNDEAPRFRYLGFSPSVNEAGMPTTIIRSLPTGSTSLYLFFDYANMTPETVYELRVTVNGVPNTIFSLSPVRWSGGRDGLWYVGGSGQPYPNGTYEFTLFIDGLTTGNARLVIGAPPDPAPEFSDVVFGILDLQGNVQGNGYVLPVGVTASARFLYRNMQNAIAWTGIWYYNGTEIQRSATDTVWSPEDGVSGIKTISIQDPNGLLPGRYRLELYIEGRLATVSDFTLAGAQDGAFARIFSDTRLTTAQDEQAARSAPSITTFSNDTAQIYALFDWQRISPGTLFTARWFVDDELFYQLVIPWENAESGTNYLIGLEATGGLPDGTYRLDLFIDQRQFDSVEARIGIGQLPIDRFTNAEGIVLRGRVYDANTRLGISGVSVFVVSEDFSAADFTTLWSEEQLFSQAVTDLSGRFQVERPLQRDAPYSLVVIAEGYLPIAADGVEINAENRPTDAPIDVDIFLTPG